jgi:hypothetical protein
MGEARLLEFLGQINALDILRDGVAKAVFGAADVVHGNNVRVIKDGERTGLGQISLNVLRAGNPLGVRNLDGHGTAQFLVACQVDAAEAAFSQHLGHPVAADALREHGRSVKGRSRRLRLGKRCRGGIVQFGHRCCVRGGRLQFDSLSQPIITGASGGRNWFGCSGAATNGLAVHRAGGRFLLDAP